MSTKKRANTKLTKEKCNETMICDINVTTIVIDYNYVSDDRTYWAIIPLLGIVIKAKVSIL